MNEYYTIMAPVEVEFKIKDSTFIAFLRAVASRQEAETCISERSRQFHDATHNCYAFRVGFDNHLVAKSSDAGEPAGTAGRPILRALERRHLTNLAAVVTRYFGGTKLGTGGLIRAYGGAVAAAIGQAALTPIFPQPVLRLRYAYAQSAAVQKILRLVAAEVRQVNFGSEVSQVIAVRAQRAEETQRLLHEACAGKIVIEILQHVP
ncbi:MAG: YigZ family protein [candidate division KSB1 bacterium]|nr:YigZ family protein [candidate division KSB1 bacterium]MDZ7366056.1 YigZ family protein [candidate division KSB1 bacterium]MDZ7404173.1 YigZ family protein [candidate division KSB1 bacterium]